MRSFLLTNKFKPKMARVYVYYCLLFWHAGLTLNLCRLGGWEHFVFNFAFHFFLYPDSHLI